MPMRGLTIILAMPDAGRWRAALTLAAAQAALGGRTRVFLQGEAVVLLDRMEDGEDARHRALGLPMIAELFDDALALGVEIIACQSGLLLAGLEASQLDRRIAFGGPVSVLQTIGEDRLTLL